MTYISPYIRLLGFKPGNYPQKELLERGFSKEDIKHFDVMIKEFDRLLLDKELRRKFYFFREGVYFVTSEAHLMKLFLTGNTHACVPVEKLVKMGYRDELAFFIERGWLQEGHINGTAVCFLGKNACDEPFVHLLAQLLNATNPVDYWPAEIALSGQVKKRLLNARKQKSTGTDLFLCYNGSDWLVTPDNAAKKRSRKWFTVKVVSYSDTYKLNLSPAVLAVLLKSSFTSPRRFEAVLDTSGQVVVFQERAINTSTVTKLGVTGKGYKFTLPETLEESLDREKLFVIPGDDRSFSVSARRPATSKPSERRIFNHEKNIFTVKLTAKERGKLGPTVLFRLRGSKGKATVVTAIEGGGKVKIPAKAKAKIGWTGKHIYYRQEPDKSFTVADQPVEDYFEVTLDKGKIITFTVPVERLGKDLKAGDTCHFALQGDKTVNVQVVAKRVTSAKKKQAVTGTGTAEKAKRAPTNITPYSHVKTRTFLLLPDKELMSPEKITRFQETYPDLYLQLLGRTGEHFKHLIALDSATRNAGGSSFFKMTSNTHIKGQVINRNHDTVQDYFTVNNISDNWQSVNAFKMHGDQDYFFTSRSLHTVIATAFHAYRQKARNDAVLASIRNHVAGINGQEPAVSAQDFLAWFTGGDLPRAAARNLHKKVNDDLKGQLAGWKNIFPGYPEFIEVTRHFRNLTVEQLPDDQIMQAINQLQSKQTFNDLLAGLLGIFESKTADNARYPTLTGYLFYLFKLKLKRKVNITCRSAFETFMLAKRRQVAKPLAAKTRAFHCNTALGRYCYSLLEGHFRQFPADYQHIKDHTTALKTFKPVIHGQLDAIATAARDYFDTAINKKDDFFHDKARQALVKTITRDIAPVKTSVDGVETSVFPRKRKLFQAFHRGTFLTTLDSVLQGGNNQVNPEEAFNVFMEFTGTRFAREGETLARAALARALKKELLDTVKHGTFKTNYPVFRKAGFSVDIADKQMFKADYPSKKCSIAFGKPPDSKKDINKADWFHLVIQDRGNRLSKMLARDWLAINPAISCKGGCYYLHVPFKKEIAPRPLPEADRELRVGIDPGVSTYATVSVWMVPRGFQPDPEHYSLKDCEELGHYYVDDLEALDVTFNFETGQFNNVLLGAAGQPLLRSRNNNRKKKRSNSNRGKGKLRFLQSKIGACQSAMNQLERDYPLTFGSLPAYQQHSHDLSARWSKVNSILSTTSQSIAAKIRDIVLYYRLKYPGVPIRVHVEELRWAKASSRQQSGYFLAHQQIRFFHSQVQHRLAHLLAEYCVPVYRVSAYRTSQKCAKCGHYSKGQRNGKSFTCKNAHHLTARGRPYATNADLNASRNIALSLPRVSLPLKKTLVFAPRYILLSINGKEQESESLQI